MLEFYILFNLVAFVCHLFSISICIDRIPTLNTATGKVVNFIALCMFICGIAVALRGIKSSLLYSLT